MPQKGMELLGLKVEERITGMVGVVTSISYDLYGCVQALLNPGLRKDGSPKEMFWFDIERLAVLSSKPVMKPKTFEVVGGPERKPVL